MGKKLLFIDNFDSFTYNLVDYFSQEGSECIVRRNNESFSSLYEYSFDGIVLSPGPGIPTSAGIMMEIIHHYHKTIPIIGICLGHQAIGEYFGARLTKAKFPIHGKKSRIITQKDKIFNNIPSEFNVVRYHSMILKSLPPELEELAKTEENEIMLIKHRNLPIYGIQYHPEAHLTEYGKEIIRNWLQLV